MKRKLTGEDIKAHIEFLTQARKDTQHLAHDEFNNGVKFVSDYVLEYINVMVKPSKWQQFKKKWFRV